MTSKMAADKDPLVRFGFAFPDGGPHLSRTIMLSELSQLLEYVPSDSNPRPADYSRAIVEGNCLGKRTDKNRLITRRYLLELYALNPDLLLFRALLYYWQRDPGGRPLLAMLCAYARDNLLRRSAGFILPMPLGAPVNRQLMEKFLDDLYSGRYSPGKLASNAKNLNSSWTQSGHLSGRTNKVRTKAMATPGSVSYALLLGFLTGARGSFLFQTEFAKLLDCSPGHAMDLAQEASQKGWLVCKRVGDVIEVLFPNLINQQEMEWLREQS